MILFHRLMGFVAFLCARMSRYRVNGIPSHFWIVVACLAALGIGGDIQRRDAGAYGKPPVPMTLSQALATGTLNQYVTITGPVDSSTTIVGKENGEREIYEPMYDPRTRQALLVKCQGTGISSTAITGVFRQVPSDLYGHLKDNNFSLGPYTISSGFQLDEGDTPINPRSYLITILVAGLPLALILLSIAQKHIIFQRTSGAFGATRREQGNTTELGDTLLSTMRLSSRLTLGPKTTQRFLEVPVTLATLDTGQEAFLSKINASIKQVDGSIHDRDGFWVAVMQTGSLRVEDEGKLYLGRFIRPALRIRYTDISTSKPVQAVAILSFDSEPERAAVQEKLREVTQQIARA